MARARSKTPKDSTATLGFEAKLWLAADKLRNNMDAAEYKHVVLGLICLKWVEPIDKLSLPLAIVLAVIFLDGPARWTVVLGVIVMAAGAFVTRL